MESKSKKNRYRIEDGKVCIEIKLRNSMQLFDSRDPAPFRERDLDDEAVTYIVTAAEDIPFKQPLKIIVYLSEEAQPGLDAAEIRQAIHGYFEYETEIVRKQLSRILQNGRNFLSIGLLALFACLILAQLISKLPPFLFQSIVEEGFLISGWVAMWRPLELFLFDWHPLSEKRKIYRKLIGTDIEIVYGSVKVLTSRN